METKRSVLYVLKYALTTGVIVVEPDHWEPGSSNDDLISVRIPGGISDYFHKGEYTTSLEEAIKMIEAMRQKELVALEKSYYKKKNKLTNLDPKKVVESGANKSKKKLEDYLTEQGRTPQANGLEEVIRMIKEM